MCQNYCCKKKQHHQEKKTGPYIPTNAYSSSLVCQQVLTLILFIVQLILHSVFIIPTLNNIRQAILWVLLAFHYTLILVIGYDYIYLTTMDPVDPLVVNQEMATRFPIEDLNFCLICNRNVHVHSYHCHRCDRCTQQFDHHCKFLNNCIGGQNYQSFFRLLSVYTLYNINLIGQTVWVLSQNLSNHGIAFGGNQWGVLTLLILTGLIEIAVGGLMGFHCYISVCEATTTLAFNYPEKKEKKEQKESKINPKIKINIWEPPVSATRLGKREEKEVA